LPGKSVLDGDILSLNPAKLAQLLSKRLQEDRDAEAVLLSRKPIRRTFAVCGAVADEQSAKSKAQRQG
jgi:hypothetical protein